MAHEEIRRERNQIARLALEALGLDPRERRIWRVESALSADVAALHELPVDPDTVDTPQDPDTGELHWVLGIDGLDSPNLIQ